MGHLDQRCKEALGVNPQYSIVNKVITNIFKQVDPFYIYLVHTESTIKVARM